MPTSAAAANHSSVPSAAPPFAPFRCSSQKASLEFAYEFKIEIKQTRVTTPNANFGNTISSVLTMKLPTDNEIRNQYGNKTGLQMPITISLPNPEPGAYYPFSFLSGPVAQRLEQGTHNPLVVGSNPSGPTNSTL